MRARKRHHPYKLRLVQTLEQLATDNENLKRKHSRPANGMQSSEKNTSTETTSSIQTEIVPDPRTERMLLPNFVTLAEQLATGNENLKRQDSQPAGGMQSSEKKQTSTKTKSSIQIETGPDPRTERMLHTNSATLAKQLVTENENLKSASSQPAGMQSRNEDSATNDIHFSVLTDTWFKFAINLLRGYPFSKKFFPSVLRKAAEAKTNVYCAYKGQVLTSFASSLYIKGLASSLLASRLTAAFGRRNVMVLGGYTFLAGAAINGGAANIAMLILGHILLGFGVGFIDQLLVHLLFYYVLKKKKIPFSRSNIKVVDLYS
ncbi:hypothetical protein NL676_012242 [Syzygium grande]|nr:hypothetical protein NL676_012242 [Syzygium grande]